MSITSSQLEAKVMYIKRPYCYKTKSLSIIYESIEAGVTAIVNI